TTPARSSRPPTRRAAPPAATTPATSRGWRRERTPTDKSSTSGYNSRRMATEQTPAPFTPSAFGRYYLLERLAVGGMAEIFRAKQTGAHGFEKIIVIKRILPHLAADPEFLAMFIDEAKLQ